MEAGLSLSKQRPISPFCPHPWPLPRLDVDCDLDSLAGGGVSLQEMGRGLCPAPSLFLLPSPILNKTAWLSYLLAVWNLKFWLQDLLQIASSGVAGDLYNAQQISHSGRFVGFLLLS